MNDKIRHAGRMLSESDKDRHDLRDTIQGRDDEIERYANQAKRLADLNEELRGLFDEER